MGVEGLREAVRATGSALQLRASMTMEQVVDISLRRE
jgi:hypothetical protein